MRPQINQIWNETEIDWIWNETRITYRLIGRVNGVVGFAKSGIHKLSINEALMGTMDLHPIRLDHRLREGVRQEMM